MHGSRAKRRDAPGECHDAWGTMRRSRVRARSPCIRSARYRHGRFAACRDAMGLHVAHCEGPSRMPRPIDYREISGHSPAKTVDACNDPRPCHPRVVTDNCALTSFARGPAARCPLDDSNGNKNARARAMVSRCASIHCERTSWPPDMGRERWHSAAASEGAMRTRMQGQRGVADEGVRVPSLLAAPAALPQPHCSVNVSASSVKIC